MSDKGMIGLYVMFAIGFIVAMSGAILDSVFILVVGEIIMLPLLLFVIYKFIFTHKKRRNHNDIH